MNLIQESVGDMNLLIHSKFERIAPVTMKCKTFLTILLAFLCIIANGQKNKVITKEKIDTLNDRTLVHEVFINIAERHTGQTAKKNEIISALTTEQQVFYALQVLEMEVLNGGFNQYYYNNGDEFADRAAEGFKAISATKFAELVTKATEIYRQEKKKIAQKQDGSLQGFSESYKDNPLNELDKQFYKLGMEESVKKLSADFIRKNKNKFIN